MADATQYRVTGALVYLKTETPDGPRITSYYQDAMVPAGVSQEQLDHHLAQGLIEPVDAPARGRKTAGG